MLRISLLAYLPILQPYHLPSKRSNLIARKRSNKYLKWDFTVSTIFTFLVQNGFNKSFSLTHLKICELKCRKRRLNKFTQTNLPQSHTGNCKCNLTACELFLQIFFYRVLFSPLVKWSQLFSLKDFTSNLSFKLCL